MAYKSTVWFGVVGGLLAWVHCVLIQYMMFPLFGVFLIPAFPALYLLGVESQEFSHLGVPADQYWMLKTIVATVLNYGIYGVFFDRRRHRRAQEASTKATTSA